MIAFKPLHKDDLQLLFQWFQELTINQPYARRQTWTLKDIENKYLPRLTGHDNVPGFIIYSACKPIGFIQYYCLSKHYPEGIKKECRAIATRYDKTARNFPGEIYLAASAIWLN